MTFKARKRVEVQNLQAGEPGSVHLTAVSAGCCREEDGLLCLPGQIITDSHMHAVDKLKNNKYPPPQKKKQKSTMPEIDAF